MATLKNRILVSFTDEEKQQVQALADQMRLSMSELMRRLVLGQPLPNADTFVSAQAITDLLKVNADLARLGNLLKLAIGEGPDMATAAKMNRLLEDTSSTQAELKTLVQEVHRQMHPKVGA